MGHVRLGTLPRTRRWDQVVALIGAGSSVADVAGAAMEATQADLAKHQDDAGLKRAFWLLLQIPKAANESDFRAALARLGIEVASSAPTAAELAAAFTQAVTKHVDATKARSDLGQMAQMAAVEVLADVVTVRAMGLFGDPPDHVQKELASKATDAQFAVLTRSFFARFMERFLGYYVGRELPLNIGSEERFPNLDGQRAFVEALAQHSRQASLIVEKFAGSWYAKARLERDFSEERTARFIGYSLKKIRDELAMGAK